MNTLILFSHIAVALVMTLTMVGVYVAALHQRETKAYGAMLLSFGATFMTGVGLLAVSPAGFGRFCVTMTVFSLLVVAAHKFYQKQSLQQQS